MKIRKKKTLFQGKNGRIEQDKQNLVKLNIELEATIVNLKSAWSALQSDRIIWNENLNCSITAQNILSLNKFPEFDEHNESLMKLVAFSLSMDRASAGFKTWTCREFTRSKFVMSWISKEQKELFSKPLNDLISLIGSSSDARDNHSAKNNKLFEEHRDIISNLVKELCKFVIENTNLVEDGTKLLTDDEKISLENLKKLSNIAQLKLQSIDEKIEEVNSHLKIIQKILVQSKESIEQVSIIVGIDELESRFGSRISESNSSLSQYNTDEMKNKILEARKLSHTINAYREIR